MRLLFFADLHLDAPFAWARPEVARARRQAIRDCLTRIADLAATLRVDALCCGGDLYEQERYTPDTAAFLRETFARLRPIPVFLAPGNHDWLGPASLYRQVRWSDNVHLYERPRLTPVPLADGVTLWGAAHQAPANTPGFLDDFRVDRGGVHLALFHGSEQGDLAAEGRGKVPHAPFRADQIGAAGLHHALVGHFHAPRDAPTHTYPGNPEPLTFGETGERGAVLVTVDGDGGVTRERHRVAVAQVGDVTVDLTGITHSDQVRERVRHGVAGLRGTVRVTLRGEIGHDVDVAVRDLEGIAPHLEVVPRLSHITVTYDLDAIAGERTVRGLFVRDVRAAPDLTDDQRRRVLITGLRALDERRAEDLEVR
jgi:DNA repair exonuclease SbcCD nuclease subunit